MNYLIAILAITSPAWVLYLVVGYIRWKEYRAEQRKPLNQCTTCGAWIREGVEHSHGENDESES